MTSLLDVQLTRDDVRLIDWRCRGCGFAQRSSVLPWSPQIAKAVCSYCEYENEVKTREPALDAFEEHVEEGKDRLRTAKRTSVSIQRKQRLEYELAALGKKFEESDDTPARERPTVMTKLGRAALIG